MTEDEARKRWCPKANVFVPYQSTGAAGNRGLSSSEDHQAWKGKALCLASGCMAWRWAGSDDGFCGLAGVPIQLSIMDQAYLANSSRDGEGQ